MPCLRLGGGLASWTNYIVPVAGAAAACWVLPAFGQSDPIGLLALQAAQPGLNGSGINVAEVEAPGNPGTNPPNFEINPSDSHVNYANITYNSSNGISNTYNDSVGSGSDHASDVASHFFGTPFGVATNVAHVDNYEAGFFIQNVIIPGATITASVINQSFGISNTNNVGIQDPSTDEEYDTYVADNPTKIFVSAIGGSNGAPISPATMYNGMGVGAYGGDTATGPTEYGGRSKPDLVAPEGESSYAAPQVAGAAAVLLQAGQEGYGGSNSLTSSQDFRVVKALLLNGAVKPAGWTHSAQMPLDPSNGAGILNVYNSFENLAGGRHTYQAVTITSSSGGNYTPATNVASFSPSIGWDFNTISNTSSTDTINHYYFDLSSATTATATLDWELQANQTMLNNLDLLLYNVASGTMVAESISTVDNVEQVYLASLPAGEYDLEVVKRGGSGYLDANETYGLAYNFAVPEPTSLMGLAGGAMMLLTRRRRQGRGA